MVKISDFVVIILITFSIYLYSVDVKPTPSESIENVVKPPPKVKELKPEKYWDLFDALFFVESSFDYLEYNQEEEAAGILQIRPIMIEDVNRIAGYEKYTLNDRWSIVTSKKIFLDYQQKYNPEMDYEKAARCWNGGPTGHKKSSTIKYWNKVNAYIKNI